MTKWQRARAALPPYSLAWRGLRGNSGGEAASAARIAFYLRGKGTGQVVGNFIGLGTVGTTE